MSIYRQHRKEGWSHLPNEPVEEADLSFRAKGMLWYILSRPDGWRPKGRHLATVSTEGRDAVYTARAELIAHGYLVEIRERDPASGRFDTVTHVFDTPGHTAEEFATGPDSQDMGVTSGNAANPLVSAGTRNPDAGKAGSGQAGPLVITDRATTEEQETPSTSGPAARDADADSKPTPTEQARAKAAAIIDAKPVVGELVLLLRERLRANGVSSVPKPGTKAAAEWVIEMDRLLRCGARGGDEVPVRSDVVRQVILFVTADRFERTTVHSVDALRRRWDQLRMKAEAADELPSVNGRRQARGGMTAADWLAEATQ